MRPVKPKLASDRHRRALAIDEVDLDYDPETDTANIRLDAASGELTENLDERRVIVLGQDRRPVALELRRVREGVVLEGLPQASAVAKLLRQRGIAVRRRDLRWGHRPSWRAALAVPLVFVVVLYAVGPTPAVLSVLLTVYLVVRFLRADGGPLW
jgi:hypothetical protein